MADVRKSYYFYRGVDIESMSKGDLVTAMTEMFQLVGCERSHFKKGIDRFDEVCTIRELLISQEHDDGR